jgi:hypothetical protein
MDDDDEDNNNAEKLNEEKHDTENDNMGTFDR